MENKFIESLGEKKRQWVNLTKELKDFEGINRILTDLYPDQAHFIYELLQNAEDTGATCVNFNLQKAYLEFSHDGRKFDESDIESIVGIGNGTKKDDINTIGKFGVGFKAVFTYTKTPEIYSGNYHFGIEDLVVPYKLETNKKSGKETTFIFPFNHKRKKPADAYNEILKSLKKLEETTLLFLENIKELKIKSEEYVSTISNISEKDNIITLTKDKEKSLWLTFRKPYQEGSKHNVAIAFELSQIKENDSYKFKKIDKSNFGKVSVFFPCEKEVSNLMFHIHAPFSTPVSRDSLAGNSIENEGLRDILLKLLDEAIESIKSKGMLGFDFISLLPLPTDNLSEFYEPIRERFVKSFRESEYIKTDCEKYKSPNELVAAHQLLKSLLSISDFNFFNSITESSKFYWVKNPSSKSRASKFYTSLNIKHYKIDDFLESIELTLGHYYSFNENSIKPKEFYNFLEQKKESWLKKLYELIYSRKNYVDEDFCKIIKLQNGKFNQNAEQCLFRPNYEIDYNKYNIVHSDVYDNDEESDSYLFLEQVGVTEIDDEQIVLSHLNRYSKKNVGRIEECLSDMILFLKYYENTNDIHSFKNKIFLLTQDERFSSSADILLDSPYLNTGLTLLKGLTEKKFLHDCYSQIQNQQLLIRFLLKVGVHNTLPIERIRIPYNHPDIDKLKCESGKEGISFNQDYILPELDKVNITLESSIALWNLISLLPTSNHSKRDNIFYAMYRRANNTKTYDSPSSFCYQLIFSKWIPDKKGNFFRPKEISLDNLHPELSMKDIDWLQYIGIGKFSEEERRENKKINDRVKKELGYTIEEFKDADISKADLQGLFNSKQKAKKSNENLRPDLKHAIGMHSKQYDNSDVNFEPDIITNENEYRENAQNNLDEKINNPKSRRSSYTRRTTKVGVKETKQFLYDSYKGLCQICGYSFKKKNGKNYFKQFDFITSKISGQQTSIIDAGGCLSLCSNCYSVVKYGDFDMSQLLKKMSKYTNDDFDAFRESFPNDENIPNCFKGFEDEVVIVPIRHKSESKFLIYTEEHFIHLFNMLMV